MPVFRRIALVLVLALTLPSWARAQLPDAPAHPSETEILEAREAFIRGTESGARARFADARREFVHSYALSGSPVALFNLASTLRSLELYREAAEAFVRLLASPDLDAQIRARATPMYVEVALYVGRLHLYGELDGATLRVDGSVPRALSGQTETVVVEPGHHDLGVDRQGSTAWTWSGTATAGSSLDLLVELDPLDPVAPEERTSSSVDTPLIAAIASVAAAVVIIVVVFAVVLDAEAQLGPRTGLVIELP